VLVVAGLLSSLVLTSVFLLVMRPQPLSPGARSLFAVDVAEPRDQMQWIFRTLASEPARWSRIHIRHSATRRGNAQSLGGHSGDMGDHFLIGNGDGLPDGAIQIGLRWDRQLPAELPWRGIDSATISICLVGDFDKSAPTALQVQRLEQLIHALQRQYGIPAGAVVAQQRPGPEGIGRQFPATIFASRLLP